MFKYFFRTHAAEHPVISQPFAVCERDFHRHALRQKNVSFIYYSHLLCQTTGEKKRILERTVTSTARLYPGLSLLAKEILAEKPDISFSATRPKAGLFPIWKRDFPHFETCRLNLAFFWDCMQRK
jgi:hypothetical protein